MRIEIELSGRCNLACLMCSHAFGYDGRDLSLDDIKQIAPYFTGASEVTLHGNGEIFLSPILAETLNIIPETTPIYFLSNGQLLTEKNANLILGRPNIARIMISMDAFDADKYRIIRGGNVDKVKRNLQDFIALRKERGLTQPKIIINATVFKYNLDQLIPLARFAQSLDGEFHSWPLIKDGAHYSEKWKIKRGEYVFDYIKELFETESEKKQLATAYAELKTFCDREGITVYFDEFMNMPKEPIDIRQCHVPSTNRIYFSNGQAKHCCLQTQAAFDWKTAGTVDFDSQERHHKILSLMADGKVPFECAGSGCKYVLDRPADEVQEGSYMSLDEGGFRGGKLTMKTRKNELSAFSDKVDEEVDG